MKNRFRHISDPDLARYMAFAGNHPDILSRHYLLQKLIIFDFIAPIVGKHRHASILEIGCGQGIHSALLSRFGHVSATELASPGSFVGADRDVAGARDMVFRELADGPVTFAHNDGRRLPYAGDSFDIVFHNSVIEHVPDAVLFNREVRRVLRPGGICICITGTPALCRFRLFKDWFLKLPFHAAVAVLREFPVLRELSIGLLRFMGASDRVRQKVRERLQRVDDRLRAVAGDSVRSGAVEPCRTARLSALYPRLFHYLYFPDYNRLVLEGMARDRDWTADRLLACMEEHFGGIVNRFCFAVTPQTHGQHYKGVLDEMRAWKIAAWRDAFTRAGLSLEEIVGYRYHHFLEWTPRAAWDMALYALALPIIRAAIDRHTFGPGLASEIIIVGRKGPS